MARIIGSVVQGAADAFAIAEVQTALQGQTRQAFLVREVSLEFDQVPAPLGGVAANQDVEVALCRRTKAAMPNITDVDVIKKWHFGCTFPTAVGQGVQPEGSSQLYRWTVPFPDAEKLDDGAIIVVEDPLFLAIDSTATGNTLTGLIVIEFVVVTITELDRLTLLTQSLA